MMAKTGVNWDIGKNVNVLVNFIIGFGNVRKLRCFTQFSYSVETLHFSQFLKLYVVQLTHYVLNCSWQP